VNENDITWQLREKSTSGGGLSPRAAARSQRSNRVTPTHGPYSYDLVKARTETFLVFDSAASDNSQVEDAQDVVYRRLILGMDCNREPLTIS
jgi:hypothetical protein